MPNRGQTHIDKALTSISVKYMQDTSAFIADKVFPTVPVAKQSDIPFFLWLFPFIEYFIINIAFYELIHHAYFT